MPRSFADLAVYAAPGVFVILWSSGFIGAKYGLPYAEPLTYLSLRMAAVLLLIGVVVALSRPRWPHARAVAHNIVAGLLVHGLYLGGVFISIDRRLPAGLAALVVGLQPVVTSTIANRWLGERVVLRQWLGLALGVSGVYLVVQGKTGGDAPPFAWIAAFVALLGITAGTLYQKRFAGGVDWRAAFFIQYASAGALFGVGALLFETRTIQWTAEFVLALAWMVLVLSFAAVWLLYFLIRHAAATRVASFFYLTPPCTALMAWAMFDERLVWTAVVGMAVCVFGVFLVNWRLDRT